MVRSHFLLKEAPDARSEDVMVLAEDPARSDVRQGLGAGGLRASRGEGLPGLTVQ